MKLPGHITAPETPWTLFFLSAAIFIVGDYFWGLFIIHLGCSLLFI